jgi:hypothetical protein
MSQYISNRTQVVNKTAIYFLTQVITAFLVYFVSMKFLVPLPLYIWNGIIQAERYRKLPVSSRSPINLSLTSQDKITFLHDQQQAHKCTRSNIQMQCR